LCFVLFYFVKHKREDNAEDENLINQKSHVKSSADNLTHEFDEFIREMFESNVKFGIYLPPNNKSVFDYFLDVITGNFTNWTQIIPNLESLIRQNNANMIQTVDTVRFTFLSALLLMGKHSILLTGKY
jgi:hypothetical protein